MRRALVDRGLVLDRLAYGDNDLVLGLLTRAEGKQSLFARGARRRKPRFGAALDLHCLIEAEWRPSAAGKLGALVRADLLDDHRGLRDKLDNLLLAGFAGEAVREGCPEAAPVPDVFDLLAALLALLDRRPADAGLWLAFCVQLLSRLGYSPELERCVGCSTPAPPGRSVRVDLERGGVLCQACRRGAATGHLLSASALGALRGLRDLELGHEHAPRPGPAELDGLRSLLLRALEQAIGKPLKSMSLLRF